ncbi:MAG: DUF983 domain-containing protein [Phyllobacterium sp.]
MDDDTYSATTNPVLTGMLGLCPRCQQGHLFAGPIRLAPQCDICGLDYGFADPADGPAFFSMTIVAVPALALALWLQLTFEPPLWAHLLTTIPVTLLAGIALLRPLKGWLVCSQYFHKAEEGSIDHEWHRNALAERARSAAGSTGA